MHAKWSPVATCIMFREPIVELKQDLINQKLDVEDRKEFVKKCPRDVFTFNQMN